MDKDDGPAPNVMVLIHHSGGSMHDTATLANSFQLDMFECVCPDLTTTAHMSYEEKLGTIASFVYSLVDKCKYLWKGIFIVGIADGGTLAMNTLAAIQTRYFAKPSTPLLKDGKPRLGGVINLNGDIHNTFEFLYLCRNSNKHLHQSKLYDFEHESDFTSEQESATSPPSSWMLVSTTPILLTMSLAEDGVTRKTLENITTPLMEELQLLSVQTHDDPSIINKQVMNHVFSFLSKNMIRKMQDLVHRGDVQAVASVHKE
eukprot:m.141295 g.141295  ORF g.141295 m.141295 type:complete len:259 (+) comp38269_c0_seq1:487-1263(+)